MNSKSWELSDKKLKQPLSPSVQSKFLLLTAYESAKKEIDTISKEILKKSSTPTKPSSQGNLEIRQKKNIHLLKIRAEEKSKEKKALKIYREQISRSVYDENKTDRKAVSASNLAQRLYNAKTFQLKMEKQEDEYSKEILERVNNKLEKSVINYNILLEKKKNLKYKQRDRAHSVNKAYEYIENREKCALMKIIQKRQESEKRKNRFMDELHEKLKINNQINDLYDLNNKLKNVLII